MNIAIILWTLVGYLVVACNSIPCSPLYGSQPCTFLPAPPGKTPSCARPGLTYCEHPDHYPGQLIHYLIEKWRFDHSTIFIDETREQFSSYYYPPPSPVYGPSNYPSTFGPNNVASGDGRYYPEPIDIPKPQHPFQEQGLMYIPPKINPLRNFSQGFSSRPVYQAAQSQGQAYTYKYPNTFPQYNGPTYTHPYHPPNSYYSSVGAPQLTHYNNINEIWKGNERLKRSLRIKRSQRVTLKYLGFPKYFNGTLTHDRTKRQSTISGEELCTSRSQFIMPRAALNKDGNWMYVVNMPEADARYTQLVKSETCVSQTCNGICSLPQGYSSRCEQRYVQKRLVALEGGGNQLYNDVFWFPSCCVCTISNT